jgi:hypothetical protein
MRESMLVLLLGLLYSRLLREMSLGDGGTRQVNNPVVIPAAFNSAAGQAGIHFDFAGPKEMQSPDQDGSQLSLG